MQRQCYSSLPKNAMGYVYVQSQQKHFSIGLANGVGKHMREVCAKFLTTP